MGDIGDFREMADLVAGCDAIVHTAGLHGHNLETHSREDFMRINVAATDNLLDLAVRHGVQRFVYSSTCQVFGHHWDVMGVRRLSPDMPPNPTTIYPLTKWLGEKLCEQASRQEAIGCVSLRYCNFNDGPWERYGTELCARSIWDGDAAQANLRALLAPGQEHGVYVIGPETRIEESDLQEGLTNPASVLERRWPGSVEILETAGYPIKAHLFPLLDISKARTELGYQPERTFDGLLDELRGSLQSSGVA